MADITIPDLDDAIIQKLKQRAWQTGVPLDEFLRRQLFEAAWSPVVDVYGVPVTVYEDGAAALN
jgi:hypothetical protein